MSAPAKPDPLSVTADRTFPGIAAAMAAQWGAGLFLAVAICGATGWR